MRYYYTCCDDENLVVYEKDNHLFPVFVELYGQDEFLGKVKEEVKDIETVFALDKYMKPYEDGKKRIYMAGPLFNEGDRYTNQKNSDALRTIGYSTFLPQEVVITNKSPVLVKTACLYMDLKAIKLCDVIIANCNGIEIDSGTAAEIGLGYGWNKKMFLYKSDVRNYYNEKYKLNNFVGGLVENKVYSTLDEIIADLKK